TIADGSTAAIALPGSGTVTLADSFTYAGLSDTNVTGALTVRAGALQRPLIRLSGTPVTLTGSPGSSLTLDGIFLSGGDIILRGKLDSVTLSCCPLDPGSAAATAAPGPTPPPFRAAADGRPLVPTRIWIEAAIKIVTADRCVLGPLRTRASGVVET